MKECGSVEGSNRRNALVIIAHIGRTTRKMEEKRLLISIWRIYEDRRRQFIS
jgi:hypothetical protein